MTPQEIKEECEKMYLQISVAEARLKYLRSICKHENTYEGNYSYGPGRIQESIICSHCGELIQCRP